jgi:hypothetical protein
MVSGQGGLRGLLSKEEKGKDGDGQSDTGGSDPTMALFILAMEICVIFTIICVLLIKLGYAKRVLEFIEKYISRSNDLMTASQYTICYAAHVAIQVSDDPACSKRPGSHTGAPNILTLATCTSMPSPSSQP